MNHVASTAAATAMMIGAGLGAVSKVGTNPPDPNLAVINPMVGGQDMLASRDLMGNITRSADHTIFVAALRKAGLDKILSSKGPFTLFAPTNAAFAAMTDRTSLDAAAMTRVLRYQIVRGKYDSQRLLHLISDGEGVAQLKTIDGGVLLATMNGPSNIVLKDENGRTVNIAIYDVYEENGVMQVVDHVARPSLVMPLSAHDLPEAHQS